MTRSAVHSFAVASLSLWANSGLPALPKDCSLWPSLTLPQIAAAWTPLRDSGSVGSNKKAEPSVNNTSAPLKLDERAVAIANLSPSTYLLIAVLVLGSLKLSRNARTLNEMRQKLPKLLQCIAKIDEFNDFHSRLSGMLDHEGLDWERGAERADTLLPDRLIKKWNPFLREVGLALLVKHENGHDPLLGHTVMHSQAQFQIDHLANFVLLLQACAKEFRCGDTPRSKLRDLTRRLGDTVNNWVAKNLGAVESGRQNDQHLTHMFSKWVRKYATALSQCQHDRYAEHLGELEDVLSVSPDTFRRITKIFTYLENKSYELDQYWIPEEDLVEALSLCTDLYCDSADDLRLVPSALKALDDIEIAVDLLAVQGYLSEGGSDSDPLSACSSNPGGADVIGELKIGNDAEDPERVIKICRAEIKRLRLNLNELSPQETLPKKSSRRIV